MSAAVRPWVLKAGGRELRPGGPLERFAAAVARAVDHGTPTVVVHGGGDEITERAAALGLPTIRIDGQRVTDAAMLEVVQEVLGGRINLRIVAALERAGVASLGMTGVSGGLLSAAPLGRPPGALGYVGRPTAVRVDRLRPWLEAGLTPVVAPLALGADGMVYNLNADLAAGAIAAALGADLALLTDVPGVLDARGRPVRSLRVDRLAAFVATGAATGGMLPKLEGAASAIHGGAASVWIGDLHGLAAASAAARPGTRLLPARPPAARASSPSPGPDR